MDEMTYEEKQKFLRDICEKTQGDFSLVRQSFYDGLFVHEDGRLAMGLDFVELSYMMGTIEHHFMPTRWTPEELLDSTHRFLDLRKEISDKGYKFLESKSEGGIFIDSFEADCDGSSLEGILKYLSSIA